MTENADPTPDTSFTALLPVSELPGSGKQRVEIHGHDLLVCVVADRHFVLENQCSHQCEPLHQGRVRGGRLYCPYHGASFDLETGAPCSAPATAPIRVYESRVRDGMLEARLTTIDRRD